MKLITEHNNQVKCLVEDAGNGEKHHIIEGPFMQAEKLNQNGRIYEKSILEKAVSKYIKESVQTGRAVGELDHPDGPTINLERISHRITALNWQGNDVYGKATILNTPMGNVAKGLIEGGCQLGVSSRGMGTVKEMAGKTYVNDDFILSTVDIVHNPSAPNAFVKGIMEGVEYFFEGNNIVSIQAEEYQNRMKKLTTKKLTEQQVKLFGDFLSELKVKL